MIENEKTKKSMMMYKLKIYGSEALRAIMATLRLGIAESALSRRKTLRVRSDLTKLS